jgi:hypothetical protein
VGRPASSTSGSQRVPFAALVVNSFGCLWAVPKFVNGFPPCCGIQVTGSDNPALLRFLTGYSFGKC